ncbi:MAG: hypothetical protein K2L23_04505, partial [Odoribacter sp.]|nr:hypothetical protein [Odoribacter sp.]
ANIYTQLYRHANTLQLKPKKISMIIHADGGIANGNVALVPRKSELYTMPPQEPTDSWLEHLCVHEFRHVIQLDKVNQGMTKGLSYLFGELFPIAVTGLYVPMWFMEGDAVCFESSVGHIGRGRSPEFLNQMKAQVVEKGIYPFQKAILGSCKDFVPNRYVMGYFMTANARINYGPDIWSKALNRTGKRPFGITPFRKSLAISLHEKRDSLWNTPAFHHLFSNPDSIKRKNTFPNAKRTLYQDNFSELQQIWQQEHTPHCFDTITTQNKFYTNYYYPTPIRPDTLIAYKQGLQETGAFVLLHGNSEQILTRTGILDDYKFVYDRHQLIWSEYRPHIRWEQGGRMRLSSYNLVSGKYKRYRGNTNQFAPFRTDNGWGFVEINNRNQAAIVLTDSTLRHETWRLQGNDGEVFIHPSYVNEKIITIVQSPKGMHLESIDQATKKRQPLTTDIYYETDNPIICDSSIIYRASYNGNNALYRFYRGNITRILESRYGLRFPYYDPVGQQLYFSFYTADGYKPGRIKNEKLHARPANYTGYRLADSMTKQEKWLLPLTADSVYPTRKYHKLPHLMNIHSWGPLYINLNQPDVDLGAVIYSQNKLSTLSFTAGYVLKSGYEQGAWLFHAAYSGWWPIFSLHIENGKDDYYTTATGTYLKNDSVQLLYIHNKARRSQADVTVQLPFQISRKQYNRYLRPYIRYKWEALHRQRPDQLYVFHIINDQLWGFPAKKEDYRFQQSSRFYQLLEYGLTFSNQTRMTDQEINPRWGQILTAGYTHALRQGLNPSHQWWCEGRFYIPGISINHSLNLYGGFQHMSDQTRNYSNKILYPRGISLYGYEIATLRCSYQFPLCFPDWQMGSVLYFKNLAGCLFYDLGSSRYPLNTSRYSSYGLELTTDTHFFQLTYPIHLGFRAGYETQTRKIFADLIFSIGLSI